MPGEEEAFAEVAGHTFFGITNGCKVNFRVPTEEKIEISECLAGLQGGEVQAKGLKELPEARLIDHGRDCREFNTRAQVESGFRLIGVQRNVPRETSFLGSTFLPADTLQPCFTWNIRPERPPKLTWSS